jgi:hypothetical protein
MQERSITKKRRLMILLMLSVTLFIASYKDLKKGFVEGYNSYNSTKSMDSKQQSKLNDADFLSVRSLLLNKII